MYVSDLALTDFRSYGELTLHLNGGVTSFVGANGQGKTNIVEAIGYLATLRSHRVPSDAALVRQGAARAVVRAKVVHLERAMVVELEIVPGKANRARINRGKAPRAAAILGIVRAVQFAPEDLALVKSGPDARRDFLDDLLVQRRPLLGSVRADYARVIKQRTALIKQLMNAQGQARTSGEAALEIWDAKAAELGGLLVAERLALLEELSPEVVRE